MNAPVQQQPAAPQQVVFNIKVTPEGLVKILDFGLAKASAPALAMAPTTAAATADIARPQDLKGKTFGVSRFGSLTDVGLRKAVSELGLDPNSDIKMIQTGGVPEVTTTADGRVRLYVCAQGIDSYVSSDEGATWSRERTVVSGSATGSRIVCDPSMVAGTNQFVYKVAP